MLKSIILSLSVFSLLLTLPTASPHRQQSGPAIPSRVPTLGYEVVRSFPMTPRPLRRACSMTRVSFMSRRD